MKKYYFANAQKNYEKNITRITIKVNNEKEQDLLNKINGFKNKTKAIKQAIREYTEK